MQRGEGYEHSGPRVGILHISKTSVKLLAVKGDIKGEVSKLHRNNLIREMKLAIKARKKYK